MSQPYPREELLERLMTWETEYETYEREELEAKFQQSIRLLATYVDALDQADDYVRELQE